MSELREMIEKALKDMQILGVKSTVERYQEETEVDKAAVEENKENIGVLSDGTRYYKKTVIVCRRNMWR